jgi:hypothetical protein
MHEDLKRQARADTPDGADPQPVYVADAMVALAETALLAGEAARPGTDRYLVHVHLETGPHGVQLMTHLGIPLPDGERRHLLCDSRLRALVHDGTTGAPLGCGRVTRTINRRMRRAIEHRDRGCCTVPGCGRTTGLEIHHIVHWEDGGATETWNLTSCKYIPITRSDTSEYGGLGWANCLQRVRHGSFWGWASRWGFWHLWVPWRIRRTSRRNVMPQSLDGPSGISVTDRATSASALSAWMGLDQIPLSPEHVQNILASVAG